MAAVVAPALARAPTPAAPDRQTGLEELSAAVDPGAAANVLREQLEAAAPFALGEPLQGAHMTR